MSKRLVSVEIAGQLYRIRSDAEEESLQRLAAYVDRAMGRVRERTGTVDSLDVAVLTCLNLAREILSLRDQRGIVAGDRNLRTLIERVESALDSTGAPAKSEAMAAETTETTPARTLDLRSDLRNDLRSDLPSIESLRERGTANVASSAASAAESGSAPAVIRAEPRVAAGGRDRTS